MRTRWPIALVWACCLARLAFYSSMLPLWEGYDEWSHFAVIRATTVSGRLLPPAVTPMPRDVEASFQIVPLPWEYRSMPWPSVTHEGYWQLPPEARQAREAAFRALPVAWNRENGGGAWTAYETQQPPLYYWLTAPFLRIMRGRGLADQILVLRWLGVLLASLAIPLVYRIGLRVFSQPREALGCAAVVAVMPAFAMNVARVGNDGVAVVLFTLLIWQGLAYLETGPRLRAAAALGVTLGLGLLTKAYFLTAIPALVWLVAAKRGQTPLPRARAKNASVLFLIAAAIAGWWYARNLLTTGTLAGLTESAMLHGRGPLGMVRAAAAVPWARAIDSVLFSHLYTGGWSWLTVRSWMYHLLYAVALVAACGLWRAWRRPAVGWLLVVYFCFWLGELYHVVLLFVTRGVATSMGWYLYAVVGAEVTLCVVGLSAILPGKLRAAAAPAGVFLFALLDLYAAHAVAVPYYSGLIRHRPNGALAALRFADLRSIGLPALFQRLSSFKGDFVSPHLLMGLWATYAAATIVLVVAAMTARGGYETPQSRVFSGPPNGGNNAA